jgi:DNA helicase-2/ATP-dependent DNA helicase PcrA
MQCFCGGELRHQQGMSKYGKPYSFWGCSRFRQGCKVSISDSDYDTLVEADVHTLSEKHHTPTKRQWTFADHKRYLPKQKRNKNTAAKLDYMRMTDEQEAVIAEMMKPGIHMVRVNADAGSGKSSLARQIAARIGPIGGEVTTGIILSFNKRPATEMMLTLPFNWVATTVHSAGNDACAAFYGVNKMNTNEYKTKDILIAEYGAPNEVERDLLYKVVADLVEMCKALVLTEKDSIETVIEYAVLYNLDLGEGPTQAAEMALKVLQVGSTVQGVRDFGHDFNDMVYLPVRNNLPVAQYRFVIGDEWQDSSPARMRLAMMMCKSSLIVGDVMQTIYGFAYADMNAMERARDYMGESTVDFPLTINWRCPSIVLNLARLLCPTIRARPNAPKGAIHVISDEDFYQIVKPGDVVLCRVNADLIRAAYTLIKMGIGAVVLGRDIGKNLKDIIVKLSRQHDGTYLKTLDFLVRLNEWYDAEGEVIAAKNLRNAEKAYQKLDDTYECIMALCGVEVEEGALKEIGIPTIEAVLAKIDAMFGEQTDNGFDHTRVVILSTVHKFKGGQAARIFGLRANEYHPHAMAVSEHEQFGEICILHVLTTRCGDGTNNPDQALFFVGGMPLPYLEKGGDQFITAYEGERR